MRKTVMLPAASLTPAVDVVKCTAMLADMAEWNAFNAVYRTYFTERYPARSAFGVNGLALGAHVEIECIAAVSK